MEKLRYSMDDIENVLARMDAAEMNRLPIGAVQLDKNGKVIFFNQAEGDIVGRSPEEVIGKNFFDEVAPCTKTSRFYGEFLKIVADGKHRAQFDYAFTHQKTPLHVSVQLRKANFGESFWVLVNRV